MLTALFESLCAHPVLLGSSQWGATSSCTSVSLSWALLTRAEQSGSPRHTQFETLLAEVRCVVSTEAHWMLEMV